MTGLIVRLIIFFAVVFGVAYGATRAIKKVRHDRLLKEGDEARSRVLALREARDDGEISPQEYDQLTRDIYELCRQKGIDIEE